MLLVVTRERVLLPKNEMHDAPMGREKEKAPELLFWML